jgi:hypothetical protein
MLELDRPKRVSHTGEVRAEERTLDPAYRPCSVCMPQEYLAWKERQEQEAASE